MRVVYSWSSRLLSITVSTLLAVLLCGTAPRKSDAEALVPQNLPASTQAIILREAGKTSLKDLLEQLPEPWGSDSDLHANFRALALGYPGLVGGVVHDESRLWILMRSGDRILYDDGLEKNHTEKMQNADMEDTLSLPYRTGTDSIEVGAIATIRDASAMTPS